MEVETPNRGKRTIIRVIDSPSKCNVALTATVSDEEGTVACLWLLYFTPFEEVLPANQSLRPDSFYSIKEPLAVLGLNGMIILRVDRTTLATSLFCHSTMSSYLPNIEPTTSSLETVMRFE